MTADPRNPIERLVRIETKLDRVLEDIAEMRQDRKDDRAEHTGFRDRCRAEVFTKIDYARANALPGARVKTVIATIATISATVIFAILVINFIIGLVTQ